LHLAAVVVVVALILGIGRLAFRANCPAHQCLEHVIAMIAVTLACVAVAASFFRWE
jgi:hypothetical protein